ncbi:hypothetical protein GF402_02645 [Candidatus Fermentibacteria bacterium]|nr:hypothetical protein [Candidatus Fermentibacteria bacterium]
MGFKDLAKMIAARIKLHEPPVIIGGCGRSGTTLLLAILSAHPKIHCIAIETCILCPKDLESDEPNARLDRVRMYRLLPMQRLLFGRAHRFCEKTPRNVRFFGSILKTYERKVRLIHIARDGREVITSRHPKDPNAYWVSKERWVRDVSAGSSHADDPCMLTARY